MNEYIIYTTEGRTTAPNENVEVENCSSQVDRPSAHRGTDPLLTGDSEVSWLYEKTTAKK